MNRERAGDPQLPAQGARRCQVLHLGLVPYGEALGRQESLVAARLAGSVPDTLILVEHPPVVTLGRAKAPRNLRLGPAELAERGIAYFEIGRGGDATYHAPGQLVGYPIFDLRDHGKDVLGFCRGLERSLILTLADFGVTGRSVPGKAGVWVGDKKIASLGISLRRWVTAHGFALNVSTDLAGFRVIQPCGEDPDVMTSLVERLGRSAAMDEVRGRLVGHVAKEFGFDEVVTLSPEEAVSPSRSAFRKD
ncbi:MAG: lipoyl(octanoyl) transferase LipB [candidate division NC10 bacterium]|nr:lipoyl(octanoyl) transferase LipB [candidate division NC10 bacterium]